MARKAKTGAGHEPTYALDFRFHLDQLRTPEGLADATSWLFRRVGGEKSRLVTELKKLSTSPSTLALLLICELSSAKHWVDSLIHQDSLSQTADSALAESIAEELLSPHQTPFTAQTYLDSITHAVLTSLYTFFSNVAPTRDVGLDTYRENMALVPPSQRALQALIQVELSLSQNLEELPAVPSVSESAPKGRKKSQKQRTAELKRTSPQEPALDVAAFEAISSPFPTQPEELQELAERLIGDLRSTLKVRGLFSSPC